MRVPANEEMQHRCVMQAKVSLSTLLQLALHQLLCSPKVDKMSGCGGCRQQPSSTEVMACIEHYDRYGCEKMVNYAG